jgi:hypothetical protein
MHFATGDFGIQSQSFHSGVSRQFQNIHAQDGHDHSLETKREMKKLQEMNIKHMISPQIRVDQVIRSNSKHSLNMFKTL